MGTAKQIEAEVLHGWKSDARLYRVDPPISYRPISYRDEEEELHETNYVIVSAVVAMFSGPETYIFPADESGEPLDMLELDGSFRGSLDHGQALCNAGYVVS